MADQPENKILDTFVTDENTSEQFFLGFTGHFCLRSLKFFFPIFCYTPDRYLKLLEDTLSYVLWSEKCLDKFSV